MADLAKIFIQAVDQTKGGIDSAKRGMQDLTGAATSLNSVLGTLGVGLSAGAFVAFVKNAVDAAARLDDMAEATGASVEELSRLSQIARIGGHDLDTVEKAMLKLTKAVSDGSNVQVAAFKAIGLSMKEVQALNADQQIEVLARTMDQFEDSAGKAAVGVALFGKQWAAIAPLLKDIVELQDVQARITAEQAAEAEKLQKSWNRLGVEAQELGQSIAIGLIDNVRFAMILLGNTAATLLDTLSTFGEVLGKIAKLDFSGAQFAKDQFQARARERDAAAARLLDEIANPTGAVVGARGRSLVFTAPDEGLEAKKRAELKRLADFARALEQDNWDAQRDQMKEEDREIEKRLKAEKDLRDQITKGQVDAAEAQVRQDTENAEALAKFYSDAVDERTRQEKEAADDVRRAWERQFDIVSESLTDALMRGFESGKDWAKNFIDTLKNMFGTLVLRPIIQAIVAPVASGITGAMGSLLPGVASAATGTPGAGDVLGIGSSIAGLIGGSSAVAGAAVGNMAIGMFGPGAAGAGFAVGAALPYIGIALAAYAMLRKKKSPAVGIGAQATGTVGLDPLLDLDWVGRSQNANQQFSWPTFDHLQELGVRDDAEKMVTDLFGKWTKAFAEVGLDPTRMQQMRLPIDFLIPFGDPSQATGAGALKAFEDALREASVVLAEQFGPALALAASVEQRRIARLPLEEQTEIARDQLRRVQEELGVDASTLDEWMEAYRRAFAEGALSPEQLALWERLAALIELVMDAEAALGDQREREAQAEADRLRQEADRLRQREQELANARSQQAGLESSLAGLVRSLPGQLGITSLEGFQRELQVSPHLAPRERLAAARGQLQDVFGRALGGDLDAVSRFPQMAQQVLGLGRDMFASGPEFAKMFVEINRMLDMILSTQRGRQQDILRNIDASIIMASNDQIGEIRKQTLALVEELRAVRNEVRRLTTAPTRAAA